MTRIPTAAKFIGRKHRATAQAAPLCGLVLSGGEGQRLRSFVKRLRGAEKLISRERLFTIVNQTHLNFPEVNEQLCDREPTTVGPKRRDSDRPAALTMP